jgi:hypothetical protein
MPTFSNRSIAIERCKSDDLSVFEIEILFEKMSWSIIYNMKNASYLCFIRMSFANMRITYEPRITSSLQNKPIKFNCKVLANILAISNDGPHVFEMKVIPKIEGFIYDEAVIMHIGRQNLTSDVKIKSQDLMLRLRLLYRVITHNILPKKRPFDEVTFMDLCFIDCMIRRRPINFPYIIMKNLIMENDKKKVVTLWSMLNNYP